MSDLSNIDLYPENEYFRSRAFEARFPGEKLFSKLMGLQLNISLVLIALLVIPITLDVCMRTFLGSSLVGIIELETNGLVIIGFLAIGFATLTRQHIQIDLVFNYFSSTARRRIILFVQVLSMVSALVLAYYTFISGLETSETSPSLRLLNKPFIWVTTYGLICAAIGLFYLILHAIRERFAAKDYMGIIVCLVAACLFLALPFIYKSIGIKLPPLLLGCIGFLLLFTLLMLKMPLGFAMILMSILGLLALMRTPEAVQGALGEIPYRQTSEFIFLAMPMFMLMGEMITLGGLSADLFSCANKWLGRLPGGLAIAAIGGCAGFGTVSGDSLATVITMSSVAFKPMQDNKYDPGLAAGSLAAGGTLGILIPPSMGFIVYSMITQESVGRLFMAGLIPGILLTLIFMGIIMLKAIRHPELAPRGVTYPLKERLQSLVGLIPIILLFIAVVGGIMTGMFTPGEGAAVGALLSFIVALMRKKVNFASLKDALYKTTRMCGVIFIMLIGVFTFGIFLTTSRLPNLLAEFIVNMNLNKYIVLAAIIGIYIALGCVMNIIPMMMLTLPSIYPTVISLGFDGVWFGVLTVIIMEMGLITPPIGLNVFTMGSLAPDIPMATIFKGVIPFFFGMALCALLLILFPWITTILPNILM